MKRKKLYLFALVLLCLSTSSYAQTDPIDPSRKIAWDPGISGGIPNRTTICSTLSPGATATDINNAIAACPEGQVVFLEAGIYNLSSGITFNNKSNVTLRGAGPTQTILDFSDGIGCSGMGANICVNNGHFNWDGNPGNTANWTAAYAKGTTVITLSSTTNLQVGSTLILDQLDDTDTDNGEIWVCQTIDICTDEGGSAGRGDNRVQMQVVRVTAINGSNITITPGLYMGNWRSSQSPGAWWADNLPVTGVGIEDLTADYADSTSRLAAIFFYNAYNCWIKNVRSLNANRNHVWLYQSYRNEVRDSYFYGTQGAASQSYGVETFIASANLVENNIFEHVTIPMMLGAAGAGNVYGYNYALDDFYFNPNWMQASQYHHNAGISYNLFEGNETAGFNADNVWGTSHFATLFRNRLHGWETGKTLQTIAVHVYAHDRYFNVVGNILGTDAYHDNYQSIPPSGTSANTSIYVLGWSASGGRTHSSIPNDTFVADSMMRWGNYDTVNDATRWEASELPSGISPYGNPVPPDQTLPNSYYLSAKPVWFGTVPWPPIGPDVTGGQEVAGHVHKIPARVCYENTPKDANNILIFNADSCYGTASSGPAPPPNLRVQAIT